MNLIEAISELRPVFDDLRGVGEALGLDAEPPEQTAPLECRTGLDERNGTAQVELSYTVRNLDRSTADALVDAVEERLVAANAVVDVFEESDLDRRSLRAERKDERYTVDFAFVDGGATATVTAVTGCHAFDEDQIGVDDLGT